MTLPQRMPFPVREPFRKDRIPKATHRHLHRQRPRGTVAIVAAPSPSGQPVAEDGHRYISGAGRLRSFLVATGMPTVVTAIRREHVESFIEDVLGRHRPATAATRYRDLQQLFRWLVDEAEIPESPMTRMRPSQTG